LSGKINKVVLAYSGGLDTSVIVRWLIETYKCEVVCFAADLGQKEELTGLKEKAINTGAESFGNFICRQHCANGETVS